MTSGGANWAIVAEYGAGARQKPDRPELGYQLLLGIWRNVVAQAASARAARTQFENGFGDALITYEQEVLWDRAHGRLKGEIVYPRSTILSEHTLVEIERNIDPGERELIHAFVAFLWSEPAQRIFVENGFRSVDERLNTREPAFGADRGSVLDQRLRRLDRRQARDCGSDLEKQSTDGVGTMNATSPPPAGRFAVRRP